jgi:para-nitrobenzyl esterase
MIPLASVVTVLAALAAGAGPVKTDKGAVEGTTRTVGSPRVQGHPLRAPPVGALRWKAPQPAAAWTGVRKAGRVRRALPAGQGLGRHGLPRRDERGLPLPQRLDAAGREKLPGP